MFLIRILAKISITRIRKYPKQFINDNEKRKDVYHFLQGMSSTALASLEDIVNTCLLVASQEETQELINRLKVLASAIMAIRITRQRI